MNKECLMCDNIIGVLVKGQGDIVSANITVSEQCGIAASKGNYILGLINR